MLATEYDMSCLKN